MGHRARPRPDHQESLVQAWACAGLDGGRGRRTRGRHPAPYQPGSPRFWDVGYNFKMSVLSGSDAGPFGKLHISDNGGSDDPCVVQVLRERGLIWKNNHGVRPFPPRSGAPDSWFALSHVRAITEPPGFIPAAL